MRAKEFFLSEAAMNPSEYSKAVETGHSQGVKVGFEFEVCVRSSTIANAPPPQLTNKQDILSIIRDKNVFDKTISLKVFEPGPVTGSITNVTRFDRHFHPIKPTKYKNEEAKELWE